MRPVTGLSDVIMGFPPLYFQVTDLLNADVSVLFYDTISVSFYLDEAHACGGDEGEPEGLRRYGLSKKKWLDLFLFVGDRGLVNQGNLDYLESRCLSYLHGCRLRDDEVVDEAVLSIRGRYRLVKEGLGVKNRTDESWELTRERLEQISLTSLKSERRCSRSSN